MDAQEQISTVQYTITARDIGQFLSVPLGFQCSLHAPQVFTRTIDKQGSLARPPVLQSVSLSPLYLTCSSGSQQTVKGQKTAGRKACKYLNHYLSQGPSLNFTASHQDRMQSANRPVPSPQTEHKNTTTQHPSCAILHRTHSPYSLLKIASQHHTRYTEREKRKHFKSNKRILAVTVERFKQKQPSWAYSTCKQIHFTEQI